jgi:hypothetical protein
MRVIIPALAERLRPEVVLAALESAREHDQTWRVEVWCMHPSNPYHYDTVLRVWWMDQLDFLLVEHDVELDSRAITELARCPRPWCCSPYNDHTLLGCTRFRPEQLGDPGWVPAAWHQLDQAVYTWLTLRGHQPHLHLGLARHRPQP